MWFTCLNSSEQLNPEHSPALHTSSGGHSQGQTNVLSRISSNSCWKEPTETQSSAALLIMVHCLPSGSDRSEVFWFNLQSVTTPQGPEPRFLRCKFTESISRLTHLVVLQRIDCLSDISAYLTVAFLWWRFCRGGEAALREQAEHQFRWTVWEWRSESLKYPHYWQSATLWMENVQEWWFRTTITQYDKSWDMEICQPSEVFQYYTEIAISLIFVGLVCHYWQCWTLWVGLLYGFVH